VAIVVWACDRPSSPIVISNSPAGAYEAALDARNGGFVAAWYDTRDGNAEIYMRLLDERGAPAGPERRLTNGPEQSYEASLKTLDDGVAIAWYDKSASGTLVAKLGVWSFDGRNQWVRTLATRGRSGSGRSGSRVGIVVQEERHRAEAGADRTSGKDDLERERDCVRLPHGRGGL
jgi:hypothetical protein